MINQPLWGYTKSTPSGGGSFNLITGMPFRQNDAEAHRDAIAVPSGDQQHEADPEKPGVILAFSALLSHGILGAALVCLAPIANEIEDAVAGWWQGGHQVLSHPNDEQMDVPIGGLEEP